MGTKFTRRELFIGGASAFAAGWGVREIRDDRALIRRQIEKLGERQQLVETQRQMLVAQQRDLEIAKHQILQRELMDAGIKDHLVTRGFERLNEDKSFFLDVLRTGVGQIRGYFDEVDSFSERLGTAELIDRDGTLFFTAHQAHLMQKYPRCGIDFSYFAFDICSSDITNDYIDDEHDVAIATMREVDIIDQYDLQPVELGHLMPNTQSNHARHVLLGFPLYASGRLHASPASSPAFIDRVESADLKIKALCKIQGYGSAFSGNSGGGIFLGKKLMAVVSQASNGFHLDATVMGAPVDFYRNIYLNLFPKRARAAGIGKTLFEQEPTRTACKFDLAQFLFSLQR